MLGIVSSKLFGLVLVLTIVGSIAVDQEPGEFETTLYCYFSCFFNFVLIYRSLSRRKEMRSRETLLQRVQLVFLFRRGANRVHSESLSYFQRNR